MKFLIRVVLPIFFASVFLIGCGNSSIPFEDESHPKPISDNVLDEDESISNPISGKVFRVERYGNDFLWKWAKFYDNDTFQGIEAELIGASKGKTQYRFTNYYGIYSIDGAKIVLRIGDDEYFGVIKEGDDSLYIYFGKAELKDVTEKLVGDQLNDMFDK